MIDFNFLGCRQAGAQCKLPINVTTGDGIMTPEFLCICEYFVPDAKVILEIGANDCTDIIHYINKFEESEGVAFEVIKEWFDKGNINIKQSNLQDRINLFHVAISDNNKNNVKIKDYGNGLSSMRKRSADLSDLGLIQTAPSLRIDTISKVLNLDSIDIAKIDVEGCSYEVVSGFGDMLNKTKILHIETEIAEIFINQKYHNDVYNLLKRYNFEEVLVRQCGCLAQFDSVFVNKNLINNKRIESFIKTIDELSAAGRSSDQEAWKEKPGTSLKEIKK